MLDTIADIRSNTNDRVFMRPAVGPDPPRPDGVRGRSVNSEAFVILEKGSARGFSAPFVRPYGSEFGWVNCSRSSSLQGRAGRRDPPKSSKGQSQHPASE